MATNSSVTDQYKNEIDGLLTIIDSSSSSGEEETDLIGSGISLKAKEKANRLERWRLLEVDMKLQKENYLINLKEKNAIIEEKNRIIEEKNRFMDEKIRFIEEKNQMFEEKCRMLEEKESKMSQNNELLKQQLEEAMGQNKMLTEERDQWKKRVGDRKCLEKKLNEVKKQLKEQIDLVSEKDDEIEKLVEENDQLFEEKNRMREEESEMRDKNEMKRQLEEVIEKNKKLTEERDRFYRQQDDDLDRLDELVKAKNKFDKQVKLVQERDGQIEKLKKELDLAKQQQQAGGKNQQQPFQSSQQLYSELVSLSQSQQPTALPPMNSYPKKVSVTLRDGEYLGFEISSLPNGGAYLSSVEPNSPAARAGLRVGHRLLEVNGTDLRMSSNYEVRRVFNQHGPTFQIVVGAPCSFQKQKF